MDDALTYFSTRYLKGEFTSLIENIVGSPTSSYDDLPFTGPLLTQIVNFIDASVFRGVAEASQQQSILRLSIDAECKKNYEESISLSLDPLMEIEKGLLDVYLGRCPNFKVPWQFRSLMQFQFILERGYQEFKAAKPSVLNNFPKGYALLRPWYLLQYALPVPAFVDELSDRIPVIFFEPIRSDLTQFLKFFDGRPAIFVCISITHFFQMLQFPAFSRSASALDHLIYIPELYPNQQLVCQHLESFKNRPLFPIYFSRAEQWSSSVLLQALRETLDQSRDAMQFDTPVGNWLYEVSKRLSFSMQQDRLGISRAPALHVQQVQRLWYDIHKGAVPSDKPLGSETKDLMMPVLADLKIPVRRGKKKAGEKLKLVHVVPQILEEGHAPTRLLKILIDHYDRSQFEVIIICSEAFREHLLEYPSLIFVGKLSREYGATMIQKFQDQGLVVIINDQNNSYNSKAMELSNHLNQMQVDVAVFHGPDIVSTMAVQRVDAPLRVLFEHGTPPDYPGFDLAIVSSTDALEVFSELYQKLRTQVFALPFALDARQDWLPEPTSMSAMGIPEDSLVMTTISTKLDQRLTDEMCYCIAEILQQVPKACYAPIGLLNNEERVQKIFFERGVADRFYPLGSLRNPSQYARSMHLYLNEFPFGSGLGILDAMAGGCPVVTMYDPNGPQQSRYGGNYIGLNRAITTGKNEDYISLACKLLKNPEMHKEWSQYTLKQYEKFADVKSYIKKFEGIILDAYFSESKGSN